MNKQSESDAEMTAQDAEQNCSLKSVLVIAGFLLISAISILDRVDLYYMSQKIHTLEEIIAKQEFSASTSPVPLDTAPPGVRTKREQQSLGIPESDIAYLYGDPHVLKENIKPELIGSGIISSIWRSFSGFFTRTDVITQDLFYNISNPRSGYYSYCVAGIVWKNSWGDTWCRTNNPRLKQKMFVTDRYFRFFTTADWMSNAGSRENFAVSADGSVTAKNPGIYIINANIHFVDVSGGGSSYRIYVKPEDETEQEKMIAKCVADQTSDVTDGTILPCPVWQLHPLKAGDRVYMSILQYNWFRVEEDTLHLALIRLNSY